MDQSATRKIQVTTLGVSDGIQQGLMYCDMLYPNSVHRADNFFIDTFELIRFKHRNPRIPSEMDIDDDLNKSIISKLMNLFFCRKKKSREDIGEFICKRRGSIQSSPELFDYDQSALQVALTNKQPNPQSTIRRIPHPVSIMSEEISAPITKIIDEENSQPEKQFGSIGANNNVALTSITPSTSVEVGMIT